jgi:phosphotransferase system HPr (HPr) family protein
VPPSSEAVVALPPDVALHARPAGLFVREAARFAARITVSANGKSANAKSILEVLALGAKDGTELLLAASGADAAEAVAGLVNLVDRLEE